MMKIRERRPSADIKNKVTTMSNDLPASTTLQMPGLASLEVQHSVNCTMEAITRLLAGKAADPRGRAFNDEMMVIVGPGLPMSGLLWLADIARSSRKHVIHLSVQSDSNVPTIAFAYHRGETVEVYEYCMLVLKPGQDRVYIVPDNFQAGAFQLATDMKLKRRRAPRNFDAAIGLMADAYTRFHELRASASPMTKQRSAA